MAKKDLPYLGPTVYEVAKARLRLIDKKIEELQDMRRIVQRRIAAYRDSSQTEAERIATAAEPFQKTQLPEA